MVSSIFGQKGAKTRGGSCPRGPRRTEPPREDGGSGKESGVRGFPFGRAFGAKHVVPGGRGLNGLLRVCWISEFADNFLAPTIFGSDWNSESPK